MTESYFNVVKYFAQGFKLSLTVPFRRKFTAKDIFSIVLSWPVLHLRRHTKELNSAQLNVPLICLLFRSTRLAGTKVLSKGYKFLNTLKANLKKYETLVTIQLIRYFQISWPDVVSLILKMVNVCNMTFLFFWRDRHRNSETKTKKRTQVRKAKRINHGVSKIFQGLMDETLNCS